MEESSPVPTSSTMPGRAEKDLVLLQKYFGAIAHLNLAAQEAFNDTYKKLIKFALEHTSVSGPRQGRILLNSH
jgi:hypothetical protein